jgi:hypothetical protein
MKQLRQESGPCFSSSKSRSGAGLAARKAGLADAQIALKPTSLPADC